MIALWRCCFRYLELFAFLKLSFISGVAQSEEAHGAPDERAPQSPRERSTTDHPTQLKYPFEQRRGGKTDANLHRLRNDSNQIELHIDNTTETTETAQSSTLLASFPTHIQTFPIRKYNGSEVTTNRLKLLYGGERQTMKKYKELLQCAGFEPEIELGEYFHSINSLEIYEYCTSLSDSWTRRSQ